MKQFLTETLHFILAILALWIMFTTTIQAFKCPKMTQTELFLHIPKSCIWNWQQCK